ncbi:probable methyltransferase-like protein 25 [Lytechinus pictus]|uniref:probable methyltransferase-like protein 25 n=1 Tax=Lytechinus pictus TaxID=7653 RepID=UPI0030B9D5BD
MDGVRMKLDDIIQFVSKFTTIVECSLVNFYTNNMWNRVLTTTGTRFASQILQLSVRELAEFPSGKDFLQNQVESKDVEFPDLREFSKEMVANRLESVILPFEKVAQNCGKDDHRTRTYPQEMARDALSFGEGRMEEPVKEAAPRKERESSLTSVNSTNAEAELTKRIMGKKKSHEVASMAQKSADILSMTGIQQVIDIGSGKGYLGQFLSMQYGINVISVDSSETNTNGALKRNNRLTKQWKGIVKNAMQKTCEDTSAKQEDCRLRSKITTTSSPEEIQDKGCTEPSCPLDSSESERTEPSFEKNSGSSPTGSSSAPVQLVLLGDDTCSAVERLVEEAPTSVQLFSPSGSVTVAASSVSSSSIASSSLSSSSSVASLSSPSSSIAPSSLSSSSIASSSLSSSSSSSTPSTYTSVESSSVSYLTSTTSSIPSPLSSFNIHIPTLSAQPSVAVSNPSQEIFLPSAKQTAEEEQLETSCLSPSCQPQKEDERNKSGLSQEQSCHESICHKQTCQKRVDTTGSDGRIGNQSESGENKHAACVSVTGFVDEETEIGDFLQCDENARYFDLSEPFMMVGLHTCGDLAPSMLRIFQSNPSMHCLCNVGCCHHLVTEEFAREDEWDWENAGMKATGSSFGFPMSEYLREKKVALGRGTRMAACLAADRIASQKTVDVTGLFYRAVFQVICRDHFTIPTRKQIVGKLARKCKSFLEYARKALRKLKMDDSKISDEEICAYEVKYRPSYKHLAAYNQLRAALSPSIEAIILLDRLLYLKEQPNIKTACIVQLFDPVTSPRCYGIFAVKGTDR